MHCINLLLGLLNPHILGLRLFYNLNYFCINRIPNSIFVKICIKSINISIKHILVVVLEYLSLEIMKEAFYSCVYSELLFLHTRSYNLL